MNALIVKRVESFVYGLVIFGCCFRKNCLMEYQAYLQEDCESTVGFGDNMKYTLVRLGLFRKNLTRFCLLIPAKSTLKSICMSAWKELNRY